MSLQDFMNSRRTFLQRSALGAGSVLFAPLLLESCTDHIIPDPVGTNPPIKPPLVGDDNSIDWNDDAKLAVTTGLQLVPGVGGFVSALVDIFWPSTGTDVWGKVQTDLEISNEVYNLVSEDLGVLLPTATGLISYLQTYQRAVNHGTTSEILGAYTNAVGQFKGYQGQFQDENNQVTLLPLFAQFANLYLALLRDGVKYGQSWGRTDGDHQEDIKDLQNAIDAFQTYADTTYQKGRGTIITNAKVDNSGPFDSFKSVNAYDRQMTMTVLDYMDTWQYYNIAPDPSDPSRKVYPNGAKNPDRTPISLFTREIYSDPFGSLDYSNDSEGISLASPQATAFPTQINVYGGNRIDAVQLTYPAFGGPGGESQTPRMGDKSGGNLTPPGGNVIYISPDRSITNVSVTFETLSITDVNYITIHVPVLNTIDFTFSDGISQRVGKYLGDVKSVLIGYDKYALSSIYIHGTVKGYSNSSADCIIFGFLRLP